MRHELEALLDTPTIVPASPAGGPMVFELPVLTAVVKEGLRRRSAAVKLEKSTGGYVQVSPRTVVITNVLIEKQSRTEGCCDRHDARRSRWANKVPRSADVRPS